MIKQLHTCVVFVALVGSSSLVSGPKKLTEPHTQSSTHAKKAAVSEKYSCSGGAGGASAYSSPMSTEDDGTKIRHTEYDATYQGLALKLAFENFKKSEPCNLTFSAQRINPDIQTIISFLSSLFESIDPTEISKALKCLELPDADGLLSSLFATQTELSKAIKDIKLADESSFSSSFFTLDAKLSQAISSAKLYNESWTKHALAAGRTVARYHIKTVSISMQLSEALVALNRCYYYYKAHNGSTPLGHYLRASIAFIYGYKFECKKPTKNTDPSLNIFYTDSFLRGFYGEDRILPHFHKLKVVEDALYNLGEITRPRFINPDLSSIGTGAETHSIITPVGQERHFFRNGFMDAKKIKGSRSKKLTILDTYRQKYLQLIQEYSTARNKMAHLQEISYYDGFIQYLESSIDLVKDSSSLETQEHNLRSKEVLQKRYIQGFLAEEHSINTTLRADEIFDFQVAVLRGIALKITLRDIREGYPPQYQTTLEIYERLINAQNIGINLCFTDQDKVHLEEELQRARQAETALENLLRKEKIVADEKEKRSQEHAERTLQRHRLAVERATQKIAQKKRLLEECNLKIQQENRYNQEKNQEKQQLIADLRARAAILRQEIQFKKALQKSETLFEKQPSEDQNREATLAQILEESRIIEEQHRIQLEAQEIKREKHLKVLENTQLHLEQAQKNPVTLKQQRRIERKNTWLEAQKKKHAEREHLCHLAKTAQWRITQNNLILQTLGPARDYILREYPPAPDYLDRYRLVPGDAIITPYQIGFFDGVTNMFHKVCSYRHALKHKRTDAFDPAPLEMAKARETRELYEIRQSCQESLFNLNNLTYAQGLEHGYAWLTEERNNLFRKGLTLANDDEELSASLAEIGLPHALACIDGFQDNFSSTTPSDFPKMLKDLLKQTLLDGKKVAKQDKAFNKIIYRTTSCAGAGSSDG